tara:strand:- start:270 stop:494 length:225 start_codon:yes stop_codon:yes gene_type:complete
MSYEDLSSKKLKIDKLLDNISVKRSLKYNSYDRKPHWTMSLAINMKKKMSTDDYRRWLDKYLAELDAKRRQKKY